MERLHLNTEITAMPDGDKRSQRAAASLVRLRSCQGPVGGGGGSDELILQDYLGDGQIAVQSSPPALCGRKVFSRFLLPPPACKAEVQFMINVKQVWPVAENKCMFVFKM